MTFSQLRFPESQTGFDKRPRTRDRHYSISIFDERVSTSMVGHQPTSVYSGCVGLWL